VEDPLTELFEFDILDERFLPETETQRVILLHAREKPWTLPAQAGGAGELGEVLLRTWSKFRPLPETMSERLKAQWRDRLREVACRWGITDPDEAAAYLEGYFKHCAFKSANPFSRSFEHDFGQFCHVSAPENLVVLVDIESHIGWQRRARAIETELAHRFDELTGARWRRILETLDFGTATNYNLDELEALYSIFGVLVETVPRSNIEFWACLLWQDEEISVWRRRTLRCARDIERLLEDWKRREHGFRPWKTKTNL